MPTFGYDHTDLVAFFIIVSMAATLNKHHSAISIAADAARALAPLTGTYAKLRFAVSLYGVDLLGNLAVELLFNHLILDARWVSIKDL